MNIDGDLIIKILQLALHAGKAIMDIYDSSFSVEYKTDQSPLTIADKTAHSIIMEGLSSTGLPLLSEEGIQPGYEIRKNWHQYWLVDPLDGTKEFIKRNGDFTVNIALISEQQPIFGVVYAPVPGILYWGSQTGSYRINTRRFENNQITTTGIQAFAEILPYSVRPEGYHVLGSRSHMNAETQAFIDTLRAAHPDLTFITRGSSLKFCTLAEGGADVYPRFGPTMEWDTAAGHAVALFAGCEILQTSNSEPLRYNKPELLNPFFIARNRIGGK